MPTELANRNAKVGDLVGFGFANLPPRSSTEHLGIYLGVVRRHDHKYHLVYHVRTNNVQRYSASCWDPNVLSRGVDGDE
jgi:hypothetical protein